VLSIQEQFLKGVGINFASTLQPLGIYFSRSHENLFKNRRQTVSYLGGKKSLFNTDVGYNIVPS
jgi:hypothetical protein